jgi:hypothetical protein
LCLCRRTSTHLQKSNERKIVGEVEVGKPPQSPKGEEVQSGNENESVELVLAFIFIHILFLTLIKRNFTNHQIVKGSMSWVQKVGSIFSFLAS